MTYTLNLLERGIHMLTIGIDPGCPLTIGVLQDGEIFRIYEGEEVATQVLKAGRKNPSWVNQAALIRNCLNDIRKVGVATDQEIKVIIEQVTIRPTESLSSGIPFVGSMFLAEGICAGLRLRYKIVAPSKWKPAMGIKVPRKNPKEPARLRALQEWPDDAGMFSRKKDHNRAEALLLAKYWLDHGEQ